MLQIVIGNGTISTTKGTKMKEYLPVIIGHLIFIVGSIIMFPLWVSIPFTIICLICVGELIIKWYTR